MTGPARPSSPLPAASRGAALVALVSLLALPWLHPLHGPATAGEATALRAAIAGGAATAAPASACALCHGRAQARQVAPGGRAPAPAVDPRPCRLRVGPDAPRVESPTRATASPRAPPIRATAPIALAA